MDVFNTGQLSLEESQHSTFWPQLEAATCRHNRKFFSIVKKIVKSLKELKGQFQQNFISSFFVPKVICSDFLYLKIGFLLFLRKKICEKMLVKFTLPSTFTDSPPTRGGNGYGNEVDIKAIIRLKNRNRFCFCFHFVKVKKFCYILLG